MTTGEPVKVLTSMASRAALAELAEIWNREAGGRVSVEASGGVEVAKRIDAGEPFDLAFLGSDALDTLIASGTVAGASKTDVFRSAAAIAVKAGAPEPDVSTEAALREAVRSARSVGYSTGPSGLAVAALFARWGLPKDLDGRLVVPPPGTPVGALVARGGVELGFQQLSELVHVEGIEILGGLPPPVEIVTVFSGALARRGANPEGARAFLDYVAGEEASAVKRRHGLEPASF